MPIKIIFYNKNTKGRREGTWKMVREGTEEIRGEGRKVGFRWKKIISITMEGVWMSCCCCCCWRA